MAYNKKYDTMSIDECIRVLTEMTDDGEYKLSKAKSPKSKRGEAIGLKYHNSLLGRLIELKETKTNAKS